MNAKQRTSFTDGIIRQWTIALFAIAITMVRLIAADEMVRIDFRNKIPGVVDAPVFDFDGTSGLDSHFIAQLSAGPAMNSLTLWGDAIAFLSDTNAGYWDYESPLLINPEISLGQRIWFQVWILRTVPDFPFPRPVFVGTSKIYSMVVTNHVMPMLGLESFSLVPEQLQITRQEDEVVVQWQYLAAARYELQTTSNLVPPVLWAPTFEWSAELSGFGDSYQIFSVTNAVKTMPQFYRLERWRFP